MTPNIRVVADPFQNAWNWHFRYNFQFLFYTPKRQPLPASLQASLRACVTKESAIALFQQWRASEGDEAVMAACQGPIQQEFDVQRDELFRRMLEVTGLEPYLPEYTCFLSTHYGSPYDDVHGCTWVYYKLDYQGRIGLFLHEYQHMLVHHYFEQEIVAQVGANGFQHIKEALTTLLNQWFIESFMGRPDLGYPMHKKLRAEIDETWQRTGDFRKVIQHATNVYPQFAQYHLLQEN